jgi:hypothetical protein
MNLPNYDTPSHSFVHTFARLSRENSQHNFYTSLTSHTGLMQVLSSSLEHTQNTSSAPSWFLYNWVTSSTFNQINCSNSADWHGTSDLRGTVTWLRSHALWLDILFLWVKPNHTISQVSCWEACIKWSTVGFPLHVHTVPVTQFSHWTFPIFPPTWALLLRELVTALDIVT